MTINITAEIKKAYDAYLDEALDFDMRGTKILRRATWPFQEHPGAGLVDFAAGFQAAKGSAAPTQEQGEKP
jgi:hypothetical protein